MTPGLAAAVAALTERKRAMGLADGGGTIRLDEEDDGVLDGRQLLVGLDLDLEELERVVLIITATTLHGAMEQGQGPLKTVAGAWLDGLLTGLILAELRANRGAE